MITAVSVHLWMRTQRARPDAAIRITTTLTSAQIKSSRASTAAVTRLWGLAARHVDLHEDRRYDDAWGMACFTVQHH